MIKCSPERISPRNGRCLIYPLESNRKSRALFSLCVGGGTSFELAAHFEAALPCIFHVPRGKELDSCTCSRAKVKHTLEKCRRGRLFSFIANSQFRLGSVRPMVHGFYYSRRGADCFFRTDKIMKVCRSSGAGDHYRDGHCVLNDDALLNFTAGIRKISTKRARQRKFCRS